MNADRQYPAVRATVKARPSGAKIAVSPLPPAETLVWTSFFENRHKFLTS
jgi:hypothetical protein